MFQISVKRIMPPKRDKVKDRERKAQKRAQMTDEEKEFQRKANRERMAAKRESMPEEQRGMQRKADKERKAQKRSEMSFAEQEKERQKDRKKKSKKEPSPSIENDVGNSDCYVKHEREFNRLYRIKVRNNQSKAEHEYEKTYNLLCMRRIRSSRNGKQHLLDNVDARKGMRLFRGEGRLTPFLERQSETCIRAGMLKKLWLKNGEDVAWW